MFYVKVAYSFFVPAWLQLLTLNRKSLVYSKSLHNILDFLSIDQISFALYRKTALMLALCQLLRDKYSLAAVCIILNINAVRTCYFCLDCIFCVNVKIFKFAFCYYLGENMEVHRTANLFCLFDDLEFLELVFISILESGKFSWLNETILC